MFYLYRHIRLDKNVPFYIGKGTCNTTKSCESLLHKRAYQRDGRNDHWNKIVAKTDYDIEILFESENESDILKKEFEFINLYRTVKDGGTLCNMNYGDENGIVTKISDEQKRLLSIKKTGVKFTEEHRKNISIGKTGKKLSEEHKLKISQNSGRWNLGKHFSDDTKQKQRLKKLGTKRSVESIEKTRLFMLTNHPIKNNPDAKRKISISKTGSRNPMAKAVIDISTGIVYDCIVDYCDQKKVSKYSISRQLRGASKNKTTLIYI